MHTGEFIPGSEGDPRLLRALCLSRWLLTCCSHSGGEPHPSSSVGSVLTAGSRRAVLVPSTCVLDLVPGPSPMQGRPSLSLWSWDTQLDTWLRG